MIVSQSLVIQFGPPGLAAPRLKRPTDEALIRGPKRWRYREARFVARPSICQAESPNFLGQPQDTESPVPPVAAAQFATYEVRVVPEIVDAVRPDGGRLKHDDGGPPRQSLNRFVGVKMIIPVELDGVERAPVIRDGHHLRVAEHGGHTAVDTVRPIGRRTDGPVFDGALVDWERVRE